MTRGYFAKYAASKRSLSLLLACCMVLSSMAFAGVASAQEATPAGIVEKPQEEPLRFVITHQDDGRFHFALQSEEAILLRSPGYATRRAVLEAIADVRERSRRVKNLPLRSLDAERHYFVVQSEDGGVLATSPLFSSSEQARAARGVLTAHILAAKE